MAFSFLSRWVNRSSDSSHSNALSDPASSLAAEADTQFLRALKLVNGAGKQQDYVQAAECFTLAAEQGHTRAQLNLVSMYEHGQGVRRDQAKALAWLTKAANLGNADAQYRLGVQQHLAGRTNQQRPGAEGRIEALKWVRLSASQGCSGAVGACEFVALGMTREEVSESGRRVSAFLQELGAGKPQD